MDRISEEGTNDIAAELSSAFEPKSGARPKTYILHRTEGTARTHPTRRNASDENKRPPCFLCYVPKPVYWLAGCLEQNIFCECFGRIGCFGHDDYQVRQKILVFGLVANTLSLFLSIAACFSLSTNFNNIVAAGFSKGLVYIPQADIPTSTIWIGLRAVAVRHFQGQALIDRDFEEGDQVVEFDEFCDYVDLGLERYMDPEDCDSCAEASGGLVASILMATLLTLPNICTDVLRMFPNYDLNCQKFFGSILNLASAMASLYAYRGYADNCFKAFYDENEVPLVDTTNTTTMNLLSSVLKNPNEPTINLAFLWRPGNGLVCILLATFLKAFDIIAMLLVPTPDIAHAKSLQEEYEDLYGDEIDSESDADADDHVEKKPEKDRESSEIETC